MGKKWQIILILFCASFVARADEAPLYSHDTVLLLLQDLEQNKNTYVAVKEDLALIRNESRNRKLEKYHCTSTTNELFDRCEVNIQRIEPIQADVLDVFAYKIVFYVVRSRYLPAATNITEYIPLPL